MSESATQRNAEYGGRISERVTHMPFGQQGLALNLRMRFIRARRAGVCVWVFCG
jgi:hypothetical protein